MIDWGGMASGMGGGFQAGQGLGQGLKKMMTLGQTNQPQVPQMSGEELDPFPLEGGGGYEGFQAQPMEEGSKFGGLRDLMMRLFGGS